MRGAAVAVGAVCVAGAVLGLAKWKGMGDDEDDCDDELPVVTREEVVQMFGKLTEHMNATVSALMRRINAQGAQIPQQMLAQYLVEHFEAQLKEAQSAVFAEFGCAEEDVESAVAYYEKEGDAKVVEAVNGLRALYMNIGGSIDLDLPEDLDIDKMCLVFEEYMGAVVAAQHAFTQHLHALKAKGAQITSQQLNETRQAKIAAHVNVVLTKHGLNNLVFQAAIEKYNDHPQFQAKIAAVKAQDQQKR